TLPSLALLTSNLLLYPIAPPLAHRMGEGWGEGKPLHHHGRERSGRFLAGSFGLGFSEATGARAASAWIVDIISSITPSNSGRPWPVSAEQVNVTGGFSNQGAIRSMNAVRLVWTVAAGTLSALV